MDSKVSLKYEKRVDGKYIPTYESSNETEVYSRLAREMMSHYIHKAQYIRRVKDECLYNGFRRVTVYEEFGRCIYIVKM